MNKQEAILSAVYQHLWQAVNLMREIQPEGGYYKNYPNVQDAEFEVVENE